MAAGQHDGAEVGIERRARVVDFRRGLVRARVDSQPARSAARALADIEIRGADFQWPIAIFIIAGIRVAGVAAVGRHQAHGARVAGLEIERSQRDGILVGAKQYVGGIIHKCQHVAVDRQLIRPGQHAETLCNPVSRPLRRVDVR